ncbi:MAG: DUF3127 domain-containing protein [Flavobacteriales bacterium]
MDITGRLKLINDEQAFASGFVKRQFVITTEEQYPQDIAFELVKDKISLINDFTVGENVKVHFNIRGNEYQGKYYVNLTAWRLEKVSASQPAAGAAQAPEYAAAPAPPTFAPPVDDDLPF